MEVPFELPVVRDQQPRGDLRRLGGATRVGNFSEQVWGDSAERRHKSDPGDALVLANILRTDLAAHRPVPDDSELAATIRVLARAQQDAVWDRQQIVNKLRSLLREYHPAMPATFDDLASADARATLHVALTPAAANKLRRASLRAALVRGGRRRNIDRQVDRILVGLRTEQFRHPAQVEQAMGQAAAAHLRALDTAVTNIAELEHALGEAFAQHPDAAILTSLTTPTSGTGASEQPRAR